MSHEYKESLIDSIHEMTSAKDLVEKLPIKRYIKRIVNEHLDYEIEGLETIIKREGNEVQ